MIDDQKMKQVRDRIVRDRGSLALLALFEREDWRGYWDLIVAGGGLQDVGLDDLRYLDGLLKEYLPLEERVEIERIVILPPDYEPVAKLVRRVEHVNGSAPVELQNINFYQFTIRTALIFHADPAEVGAVHA
jgi:hypothetical protein